MHITEHPDPKKEPELWRRFWLQEIEDAHGEQVYEIEGSIYARVPYGQEYADMGSVAKEQSCHDCAVKEGQLHVPGCDVEICPRCQGQTISCGCAYYPEDSMQMKKAAQQLRRMPCPTKDDVRRLGFHV